MEVDAFKVPRRFHVGLNNTWLAHVANIALRADEMITFTSSGGREYDFAAKDWGYYATPSVDGRLRSFGMRAALMRNVETRHLFVVIVFDDCHSDWMAYMETEKQELVIWLDEIGLGAHCADEDG